MHSSCDAELCITTGFTKTSHAALLCVFAMVPTKKAVSVHDNHIKSEIVQKSIRTACDMPQEPIWMSTVEGMLLQACIYWATVSSQLQEAFH